MENILPHIAIGTDTKGLVNISIEDYELFDYIDDYLNEQCDAQYEYMSNKENSNGKIYTMHFSEKYSLSVIQAHLSRLDPNNVKEIYSLNN